MSWQDVYLSTDGEGKPLLVFDTDGSTVTVQMSDEDVARLAEQASTWVRESS